MASAKVTEVLNLIKSGQKTIEIFVPSLKKNVKFKHLTAGQQEKFVQALVDNPAVQTRFTLTLIDVIKECCEDKSLLNLFTIIDKYAIGISLRAASLGANLKTEVESEPGLVYNIDLNKNVEFIKEKVKHDPFDSIELDEFKLELQYPTLTQEASNERFFKREESSFDQTAEGIRSIISNAFIGDVIMFIKTLTINKAEGDPLVVDLNQLTLQDKLEIVRKLPITLFDKLLTPMAAVKGQMESILRGVGVSDVDAKVKRSILVSFDASLFIAAS